MAEAGRGTNAGSGRAHGHSRPPPAILKLADSPAVPGSAQRGLSPTWVSNSPYLLDNPC